MTGRGHGGKESRADGSVGQCSSRRSNDRCSEGKAAQVQVDEVVGERVEGQNVCGDIIAVRHSSEDEGRETKPRHVDLIAGGQP